MPRRAKAGAAVDCKAHGRRCALGGGSRYSSDLCGPIEPRLADEIELSDMIIQAKARGRGVPVAQYVAEQEAARVVEQRRRDRLPLARVDAEDRKAHAHMIAQLEARNSATLAEVKERIRRDQADRDRTTGRTDDTHPTGGGTGRPGGEAAAIDRRRRQGHTEGTAGDRHPDADAEARPPRPVKRPANRTIRYL